MSEMVYLIKPIANSLKMLAFTGETVVYLLDTESEKFISILMPTANEQGVSTAATSPICVEACQEIVAEEFYLLTVADEAIAFQLLDIKNQTLVP